ncbi:30S ribosomal protein S17 [Candidatus Saganbacteria bacterium]|uniref:Small ribosomal subunit protein uS17 n=1 Tax=Candidatus Saganbacteria bacterium TaxID=2575572 RepID=A0A9D6UK64_UNCSA|nr:30S ribosomal protein S17 [Candidatus Saganbacteria bacterium]
MKRKIKKAVVVSANMQITIVVEVERVFQHPLYQKVIRITRKFKAHDELNRCKVGDRVEIMGIRPVSRDKHWCVVSPPKTDKEDQA